MQSNSINNSVFECLHNVPLKFEIIKNKIFCRPMSQFQFFFLFSIRSVLCKTNKYETTKESQKSIVNCHLNRI